MLKLRLESSSCQRYQYWRAPRPRPKPNRRAARSRSTPVIRAALSSAEANQTPAEDVIRIWVLKGALRKAVDRAAATESELKEASCGGHLSTALADARAEYWEQRTHDMTDLAGQLEDTKRKAPRSERKREKPQLAHHGELSEKVQSHQTDLCGVC